jgi:putative hydrolase of the HAD superfamily
LRAVVFDYGMVLSGPPDPTAHAALARLTGLTPDGLESLYWVDRPALDQGRLTAFAFWKKLGVDAGLELDESTLAELCLWDARLWTTENPAMVAWQQQLKQRGLLTAVLSNMGENVLDNIQKEYAWLSRFDVLVWSFQLDMIKPAPAIYRHVLKQLGAEPEETLFLDDRVVNVEAANALGMQGLVFTTVEQLRSDLIERGLDAVLPLPA